MARDPTIETTRLDDDTGEEALRPQNFEEFVGQTSVLDNLRVMARSARIRETCLDHVLLCGPPGLGKTSMAHILAREMNVQIHVTSGPAIEKKGDLAGILTSFSEGEILFIDECHRLNPAVEENLYPAMEDFFFDLIIGEGAHARSMKLSLPRFTLIGATTRAGMISSPLWDRFGHVARLSYYSDEELRVVVKRSARILEIPISEEGAFEIARRSRGTPRIANRLLRRVRDYAVVHERDQIDADLADFALEKLEVDRAGLDYLDRLYLEALVVKFGGGPTGLDTLSSSIGEEKETIKEVVEPFLLQQAFIQTTARGRMATPQAFEHLGVPISPSQKKLL